MSSSTHHIELTEQALQNFAQETQAGGIHSLIQDLTISGIPGDDAPHRRMTRSGRGQTSRQSRIDLLTQCFNGLAKHGLNATLSSLSLKVAVPPQLQAKLQPADARLPFDWKPVWEAAADTLHITFRALASSQLRVKSLNIFNGPEQQRCSVACNELSKIAWNEQGLTASLSSVRTLSISTSNRVTKSGETGLDGANSGSRSRRSQQDQDLALAQDEANFTGLASFLRLLKRLEAFDMHYFCLRGEPQEPRLRSDWRHERLLHHLIELENLPSLTRCKLRGIHATETDLLALVKRTGVSELSMENVFLSSGTFRSIFDYCTSTAAPITKIHFDVLYEMSAPSPMVLFLGPGLSMLGYTAVGLGSELLERGGEDVKQPISYHVPVPPPMGSPAIAEWRAFQRREYGNI